MNTIDCNQYQQYKAIVQQDFSELRSMYPFAEISFLPTVEPSPAIVSVIAVHKNTIDAVNGKKSDFLGKYSKQLRIIVPFNYQHIGCTVYGAGWVDLERISEKDRHFFFRGKELKTTHGFEMCVGVLPSFQALKNVLLENVKTAEHMLIAYERLMRGETNILEANTYSHGSAGAREYFSDRKRYKIWKKKKH